MITANAIVNYLNRLLLLDKDAVQQLFNMTVSCNKLMQTEEKFTNPSIDFLTIINSLLYSEVLIMHVDDVDTNKILYFSYEDRYSYLERVNQKKIKESVDPTLGINE